MTIESNAFTQGGQTSLHKFRMLRQVFGSTIRISMASASGAFLIHHFWDNFYLNWMMVPAHFWATMVRDLKSMVPKLEHLCFFVNIPEKRLAVCDATWFLDPNSYPQYVIKAMTAHAAVGLYWAGGTFLVTSLMAIWYFVRKGDELKEMKSLSGFELLDLKGYISRLKSKNMTSSLKIDGIPIPESAETKHFMVAGTTGSGKTNFLNHLIQSIRDRGDRAVIVDTTGGFVGNFYDETRDVLLNPFDARGQNWNLWGEGVTSKGDFASLAESIIVDTGSHDKFWINTAREAFTEVCWRYFSMNHRCIQTVLDTLLKNPLRELSLFFKNTTLSSAFSTENEKTSLSIRATLATSLTSLEMIDDSQGGFSIHDWMHQKSDAHRNGFLYLHCKPKHRASLKPLLTAWISTAIQALMDLEPDAKRRVWFIVDELASLHKLPALGTALAEARKYGGCFVLGVQDLSQLEDTYGVAASRFLSELCVSKVFFQTVDATNAKRLSYMLGEREVLESNENISFGANEIRDGVSLSHHKKMKPVVGMSDIMGLSPLQSYLKIADVTAVLFYQFCYAHLVSKNPLYVEKDIPKTVKAETQNTEEKPPSPLHDHMEKILTDVKETNHDKENTNTRSRMGRKDSSPPVSRE